MLPGARVRELSTADDPSFGPAIELYERSFPNKNERESLESIRHRLRPERISYPGSTRRRHFLVCEDGDRVVGMRIHDYAFGTGLGWLVYLAVDESARGHGIGALLLRCGIESCRLDALFSQDVFRGAVMEVERVEDSRDEEERRIREARIRFFIRHGARKLTGSYVQPALRPDSEPVPLNLFIVGWQTEPDQAEKRAIVCDFMTRLWEFDELDPLVERALADF